MSGRSFTIGQLAQPVLIGVVVGTALSLATPAASGAADLSVLVRGGLAYSHYGGSDYDEWASAEGYDEYGTQPGAVGGAGMVYGFTRFLAAGVDLLYANTGGSSINRWMGTHQYDTIEILELPVTAVLRLRFTSLELYVLVGPSVSLRLSPVDYMTELTEGTWPESQFSRFAVGYVWGCGFNLHFRGGFFLSFDDRNYNGLTSIRNVAETGLEDWYQESLQLTVGLGKYLTGEAAKFRGRSPGPLRRRGPCLRPPTSIAGRANKQGAVPEGTAPLVCRATTVSA